MLGALSFALLLCSRHIADGDLWAKLALGAHIWKYGTIPHHDVFAFTPVLPEYVDHEWGAGTIFFGLLKYIGPDSLMWLKVLLALGAIAGALTTGRRAGCGWAPLLILAIPAAACLVLGYVPVIRSHVFTYFFFALTLLCLEEILASMDGLATSGPRDACGVREACSHFAETVPASKAASRAQSIRFAPGIVAYGKTGLPTLWRYWPAVSVVGLMLIWVNVHGGFVAGVGTIAIYTCVAAMRNFLPRMTQTARRGGGEQIRSAKMKVMVAVALGSLLVTCLNPYGVKFWSYIVPAVLAKRPLIAEWQPLPLFASDVFMPFRILFLLVIMLLIAGWKRVPQKSWTGLIMLAVTAFLAWRSRRHAPFFGVAALAFAGPYLAGTLDWLSDLPLGRLVLNGLQAPAACSEYPPNGNARWRPLSRQERAAVWGVGFAEVQRSQEHLPKLTADETRERMLSLFLVVVYGLLALYAVMNWLPQASFQVLAPIGHDQVREADILSVAEAKGHLATPFHWGSYCAWRLYPNIKISMDGRYEAAFPESTFQLNAGFFDKSGPDWARLVREYPVDYALLDLSQAGLKPQDLCPYGYALIWVTPGSSALVALEKHAERLRRVAAELPPTTINPLDAAITDKWWSR